MTESRAERQARVARVEKLTEERMHSTAEVLPEPNRSRMHERANQLSERAARRADAARRDDADEPEGKQQ